MTAAATSLVLAPQVTLADEKAAAADNSTERVETAPDEAWISVSGTIVSTTPSSFRLDHGDGIITVEMDDFDSYGEGRSLMENDQVIVHGRIDHDLFERRTIEAGSVYVENLMTHFFASPADEEDLTPAVVARPLSAGDMEMTGMVTSVEGREFTIDIGATRITVDTSEMTYNPLDLIGYQRIEVGDRVTVGGDIDTNLFSETELDADYIVELWD